jgi:hypothetical protein
MALKNILPRFNQLFRPGNQERLLEPLYINPVDILRLMEGLDSRTNDPDRHSPKRNPLGFESSIPEPGFRY